MDVFLRFTSADVPIKSDNFVIIDSEVPDDVKQELNEKLLQTQAILNQNDLIETLQTLNIRITITPTAFRSR